VRFLALIVLLAVPTLADAAEREKQYPDLFLLVERASSVPPEFAASTLLRVAASPALVDRTWKKELLIEAFRLGGMSKYPIRKAIIRDHGMSSSLASLTSSAYSQKLDRISLQSLAVQQMIPIDRTKAWELFNEIQPPSIVKASCDDVLLDDPTAYYELLPLVVRLSVRSRNDELSWLNNVVVRIQSPVELPLIMSAIGKSIVRPEQWKLLGASLAGVLDRLSGDDRAFTSSLPETEIKLRMFEQMVQSTGNPELLIEAHRNYVIRHMKEPRCGDSKKEPLFADDSRVRFMHLMFGGASRGLSDADKNTESWRDEFQSYLRNILDLKPQSAESDEAFFLRKSGTLTGAVTMVPTGPEREKVVVQFLSFLKNENMQQDNFLLWFDQLQMLADLTRSLRPSDHESFLRAVEATGHPVMSLYAMRERILPTRPAWVQ
jgi:hypothetical protein